MRFRKVLQASGVICAALIPALVGAFSAGPDPRYTGAPGDSPLACASAGCHTGLKQGGPINAAGGKVEAAFCGGTNYTPGVPQTVTVTVSDPVNTRYGFQMTARLASNLTNGQAGDFTPSAGTIVLCDNGSVKTSRGCNANALVQFIEHSAPSASPNFTFTWTPPATDVGPINFYVAGNAVNNNTLEDSGDHVYTKSYVLTPSPALTCSANTPNITNVITAGAFGGLANYGAGSWLEVYGTGFSSMPARQWACPDFNGANAPTKLDNTSVTINGKPGFVFFSSEGQVNVQAPDDNFVGPSAIVVTNCTKSSQAFNRQKTATAPGLLAPDSFIIGGKQFLVAQFSDGAYVLNTNAIPGLNSRPAKPGDNITVYGIGFGDTTPANLPGIVVSALNSITAPVTVSFGSTAATLTYKGLAPGFVGLYQFNITVPNVPDGDQAITVTLGGTPLQQQPFFLTVRR
ncbi:MAG TPA: choice-of-anchor V domain-containing protein [Bryobacteraceae bacterium]|jgi:uncharacterized protein (TIGR03437 family)|nr:choice-of-anchor V domain-containing protein [Bryobacteraceae bacterium]